MQDRFKFRFWDKEKNVMIYSKNGYYKGDCFNLPLADMFINSRFISMQCTGLKDKNKKLIYEGDILKDKYGALHPISWNVKGFYEADTFAVAGFYNAIQEDMEVIGNIYENAELIKE